MNDNMFVRQDFTQEEMEQIDVATRGYLWELSESDLSGMITWLHEKLTIEEQVLCLSDDHDYIRENLGFDPFVKED